MDKNGCYMVSLSSNVNEYMNTPRSSLTIKKQKTIFSPTFKFPNKYFYKNRHVNGIH